MTLDPLTRDFLLNLAAGLTQTLLEAGARRLRQAALGTDEERALKQALQEGFTGLLAAVDTQLPPGELREEKAELARYTFEEFLRREGVADNLLDLALAGRPPDLEALAGAFDTLDFDRDTLPVDFEEALTAFHRALTAALVEKARQAGSTLFQQVSLGRLLAIQALLEAQQTDLQTITQQVRRLENVGGRTVYNVVIERAVGPVAIGTGAQAVEQLLPPELQQILVQILEALERLAPLTPPAFGEEDLHTYLENVQRACGRLDLVGAGLPVSHLPLESVYVALKADRSSAAERRANRQLLQADWAALEQELDLRQVDERERLRLLRRFLAGHDPTGLTRAFTRGDREKLRINLGQLVAQERWAVLLGDPGAGKTTLLRWLGLQFAQAMEQGRERVMVDAARVQADEDKPKDLIDLGPTRLPVLVRLADYEAWRWDASTGRDSGRPLVEYLGRQPWLGQPLHPDPEIAHAMALDYLRRGRALILLDGLDEIVDPTRRSQVVSAVEHFLRTWVRDPLTGHCPVDERFTPSVDEEAWPRQQGGNQTLVTSRPIGYYLAPLDPAIPHYTVEEMTETGVRRFCQAWAAAIHRETGQGDPEVDAAGLAAALWEKAGPGLREIVVNPLLLTILASLHYSLEGPLPQHRVELYDAVVAAFIRQRADAWKAVNLGQDRIRYALGYAAAWLHASPEHPNGLVEEADLVEWLEEALEEYEGAYAPRQREQAQALLVAARSLGGFLLERGQAIYGFIHRTFQEYFAGHYLAANRREALSRIQRRLDAPAWQEVLTLAVAECVRLRPGQTARVLQEILDTAEPLPDLLPQRALFLARCLPELPPERVPQDVIETVVERLVEAYADRTWPPSASSQPPEPLREAIEAALGRLQALPGAAARIGCCLLDERPTQRLAASELILATRWTDPALVAPLLEAARTYAEPAATVREALIGCYEEHPEAFTSNLLPLRRLLADRERTVQRWQSSFWQIVLRFLYLRPDYTGEEPPGPGDVYFDSRLSPWLSTVWVEEWPEERMAEELLALALGHPTEGLGRDSALILAVWQPAQPANLLAALPGKKGTERPGVIPLLAWHFDRARDRARDRALDLDLSRVDERIAELNAALVRVPFIVDAAQNSPQKEELQALLASIRQKVEGRQVARSDPFMLQALTGLQRLLDAAQAEAAGGPLDEADGQRRVLTQENLDAVTLWPRPAHAALLLPDGAERKSLLPALIGWSTGTDPILRTSSGLLLAEMGEWGAVALGTVVPLLVDGEDLFRYRARQALLVEQVAAIWGWEKLEWLADPSPQPSPVPEEGDVLSRREAADGYLIETTCTWALNRVEHDRGDWLREWVERYGAGEKHLGRLLSSIHKLSDEVWPVFVELLTEAESQTLSLLLESASWLLREGNTPPAHLRPLAECLVTLAQTEGAVERDALEVLGHFPFAPQYAQEDEQARVEEVRQYVREELLNLAPFAADSPGWVSLARLAGGVGKDDLGPINAALVQAPPGSGVDAALARLVINSQLGPGYFDPNQALATLAALRPDPQAQLRAFLAAGSDNDIWNEHYHERAAACVSGLVQQHDDLLPLLVGALAGALDEDSWPRHRMALAGLARLAQDAPGLFNRAGDELQGLLLRGTRSSGSFNARRFAITALSHLREISPAVLVALLRLAGDEASVQRAVIRAAGRFNRLHPSLGEELPPELAAALSGVSSVRAYVAVKVLEALGTSAAARSAPTLRAGIVDVLATALRDENNRRPVWLFAVNKIRQEGTLDQHLYTALLRVAGFSR